MIPFRDLVSPDAPEVFDVLLDRVGCGKMKRSRLNIESMSVQLSPEQMVMIRETLELDG